VRSSIRAELLVELQIQDSIIAGRSPLELGYLLVGGAAGWTVFQIPGPLLVRTVAAVAFVGSGAAFAFVRLGGQDLTTWCFAVLRYFTAPRVALYGPSRAH
jgi:hypothetical protein